MSHATHYDVISIGMALTIVAKAPRVGDHLLTRLG
jgi:hypothetical protein